MASGAARCGAPGDAFAAPAPDPGGPGVISRNCRSAQRQGMVFVNLFDVRIHAIRHRRNRRRPFEVRWHAADRSRSKSFITRRLADSYRAELVSAARRGLEFDPVTGEPVLWAAPKPAATTWYRHALAYTDMKWPELAAHSREHGRGPGHGHPCPDDGHRSAPASASAAGRAIRARFQPATPDQEAGSGDGSCAGVAGACLAASGPAAESAGDPAGTGCPRRAAG